MKECVFRVTCSITKMHYYYSLNNTKFISESRKSVCLECACSITNNALYVYLPTYVSIYLFIYLIYVFFRYLSFNSNSTQLNVILAWC